MSNIERKIVRKADGEMIRRAVTNLIRNAIIHSGTRDISVSLRKYGSSIRIIVEDHGKGIPVEYRERVFERFFRLDESRDEKTGGTGLGLAIVKRIAEAHNGEVRLEEPAGGGSRFIIDLPSGTDDAT